ncbi:TauD/TfdA dioxygenase family protein [Azospirillum sp. CT11-132]|uniref:TauD/TfdA dioxygenase family protein n=1 Tax=Azospirillum sp. CT11-132 TaxID=3396317 RepID=UPI0039A51884
MTTLTADVATRSETSPAGFGLDIRPIGGRIGAEVHGFRLSGDLQPATVHAIRQALTEHKVLFFRGQTHLDEAEQEAFGRLFGDLVSHPTVPSLAGTEHVLDVDGSRGERASSWHADVTFVPDYPSISILRSVVAPRRGGDTMWADNVSAYNELPEPLRELAEKLWVVHSNVYDYVGDRQNRSEQALHRYQTVFTSTRYETEHPLVHVHSESGVKALILGHFAQRIAGLTSTDSRLLLDLFQGHATRPENVVRWRWSPGDVAVWDNRTTQHRAVDDYDDQPRVVRRVTVAGAAPVAVGGRRSFSRSVVQANAAAA